MVDLDDIFKQAMQLRNNNNKPKNNNRNNRYTKCKVCGAYSLVVNPDGDDMVCMECGAAQGVQLMNNAPEFDEQNAPVIRVVYKNKEEIDYIGTCVERLHREIYGANAAVPVEWVEHTKRVYRNLLKERGKKLHGVSLALVCGVIVECLMIAKRTPVIRPRMIESAMNVAVSFEKFRGASAVTYERYRTDEKSLKLRTVLKKEGCFARKPTIYEYTVFAMNRAGFDATRRELVLRLSNALQKLKDGNGNADPMMDDVVLSKTNDEIAACVLLIASDAVYDISKVKTVYGMSVGRLKPMNDAILKSEHPVVKKLIRDVNLNKNVKLVNAKKQQKSKNYFTINGRKCESLSKEEVIRAATEWVRKKNMSNVALKKQNGKYRSIKELCALMSQN